jgi:hypothetical protein
MNRRSFLGTMLAACAAPAIVRASSLMKLAPGMVELESGLVVPTSTLRTGGQLLTIEEITREALRVLNKNMTTFRVVSSDYPGQFEVGDFITIGGH